MKSKLSVLVMLLCIVALSCSKDKDNPSTPKADFTAVAGDWKSFASADVDIFNITGRGTVVTVADTKVNSNTLNSGTLLLYIRNQGSATTSYHQVPFTDAILGTVGQSELGTGGISLLISKNPATADRSKLSIRGIIIPSGKSIPASVNAANYTEVAAFLNISQ